MKKLLAIALSLSLFLGLAACGASKNETTGSGTSENSSTASSDSAKPETLRVGTLDATDTFDPCANSGCGLGLMMVFDTILKLNYDTMEVGPCIASAWNWVDDKTLALTIRDDVTFSNGDKLTPADVLYSLSRFVNENDQFDPGYKNIDFDKSTISGNTLTLVLKEIDADFLNSLANDRWASVVDEKYVKANPDSWWDKPIGSGPYTCVENVEGSHSTYAARSDYWGNKPDAEKIIVNNYSESTTMIADFQNDDLDVVLDVPESDYKAAQNGDYGEGVQTKLFKTWDLMAVCLPSYTACFQDAKVRKAISLALDTKAITTAVYGSLGETADSILINGCDFYSSIGVHDYDPQQAKELLKEAGYGDGLNLKVVIPSTPTNDKCAQIVQADLDKVGIKLSIESYDFATAIPILMANGTDISIFGTGGGTYTAASITDTLGESCSNSGARVSDTTFNGYLNAARTTLDKDTRLDNYTKAAKWAYDNYWTLPISYAQAVDLYQSNISGVNGLIARSIDLETVVIN
jgi:peptide/nickel transport system substrate-binding protein